MTKIKEKHPLSYQYASSIVEVIYLNGHKTRYDNIHYPSRYLSKILEEFRKDNTIDLISSILVFDKKTSSARLCYVNPKVKMK